jgi:chromosome segregation ATPase
LFIIFSDFCQRFEMGPTDEFENLKEEQHYLTERYISLINNIENLKTKIAECERDSEQKSNTLQIIQKHLENKEIKVAELSLELSKLNQRLLDIQSKLFSKQEEINLVEADRVNEKEIESLNQEIRQKDNEINQLTEEKRGKDSKIDRLQEDIIRLAQANKLKANQGQRNKSIGGGKKTKGPRN